MWFATAEDVAEFDHCVACGGELEVGNLVTVTAHPQVSEGLEHDGCDVPYLDIETGEELD